MEKKEFREQVLNLRNEVIKTRFKWENVFRAQVLNEDRTEWVIMIGDKLASKELFADEEQIKRYIDDRTKLDEWYAAEKAKILDKSAEKENKNIKELKDAIEGWGRDSEKCIFNITHLNLREAQLIETPIPKRTLIFFKISEKY